MDNFDDMYSESSDSFANETKTQGIKRKASLNWNSGSSSSSTSTATATSMAQLPKASASEVSTDDLYHNYSKDAKISAMDIKRRAVLDWNWGSMSSGSNPLSSVVVPPPPPPPPLPNTPAPELSADEIDARNARLQAAAAAAVGGVSRQSVDDESQEPAAATEKPGSRKIYVSGLPPNITEKPLAQYFSTFGTVQNVNVVRDKHTGISRGFGFVTFMCETEAEAVLNTQQHILDGRPIRVNAAFEDGDKTPYYNPKRAPKDTWMDSITLPPDQTRIYVGPLDDDVLGSDLQQQFVQFGAIRGVSKLRSSETSAKKSYGFIDFYEPKSMMRAFGSKIFVKGKHVRVALSRFAMEVLLSNTVVFFYDAHLYVDEISLEKYFSQYGQVFRTLHFCDPSMSQQFVKKSDDLSAANKNYGYVDFIKPEAAKVCAQQRSQLIPPAPGQYVRLAEWLPTVLLYDFMSISEKDAEKIVKRLEKNVPDQGTWGTCHSSVSNNASQVRIPAALVSKLIGERGKTISEICRDSKTKISVPRVRAGDQHVVISVHGGQEDIKIAQYLMQKTLKGNR